MTRDVTRLFTIPVTRVWVPETAALRQELLPKILRRYETRDAARPAVSQNFRASSGPGAHDPDDVLEPVPSAYERLLRQFVTTDRFRLHAWHSIHWKGQEYEAQHHEVPWHVTLIHFLAFDRNEHAPLVFYDPARQIKAYCLRAGVPTEFWGESETLEVFEGDALIFPSYLEHRVAPGIYREPRVTISVNLALTGDG